MFWGKSGFGVLGESVGFWGLRFWVFWGFSLEFLGPIWLVVYSFGVSMDLVLGFWGAVCGGSFGLWLWGLALEIDGGRTRTFGLHLLAAHLLRWSGGECESVWSPGPLFVVCGLLCELKST